MSRRQEYYEKNREKEDARKALWAREHPETRRAWVEKNRERVREDKRKYYEAHRQEAIDRAGAWNRKKREAERPARLVRRAAKKAATRRRRVEGVKQWRKDNPDKAANNARNYCNRRRAKYKDPGMAWGAWAAIKEDYGHRCAYCARQVRLEQDHLDPLALGGRHNSTNVVPACRACNGGKSDDPLIFWLHRRRT